MHNLWLIAKHEYRGTVLKRAFILLTLAIPLGMIALIALAILVATFRAIRPISRSRLRTPASRV